MDEDCPRVSVVVPVYAGASTLPELVKRCFAVRSGPVAGLLHELIFVCDEPVDDSERVLKSQESSHDWIRVVSLSRNSGQHMATAVGLLYSSGDWILTIDEDLQHPPELLPELLLEVLRNGLDLLYIRSSSRVHASSIYRDVSSHLSKFLMRLFTRDDYSIVSSFRLMRGEIARSVAVSIDTKSYLDASLFAATGKRRRGVYHADFKDVRSNSSSGYTFLRLLQHYVKLILAAELSGFRLMMTFVLLIATPLILGMGIWIVHAISAGSAQEIAPGWLSLFALGISIHVFLVIFFVYTLKILYAILSRSAGMPPFLVINRSLDERHSSYLGRLMA